MDHEDKEFETFLREFQPVKPPALPEVVRGPKGRPVFWLAAAAAVIASIGIGIWLQNPVPQPIVSQTPKPRAERTSVSDARLMEAVTADLATPLARPMEPLLASFPLKENPIQTLSTTRQTIPIPRGNR